MQAKLAHFMASWMQGELQTDQRKNKDLSRQTTEKQLGVAVGSQQQGVPYLAGWQAQVGLACDEPT